MSSVDNRWNVTSTTVAKSFAGGDVCTRSDNIKFPMESRKVP